MSDQAVYVIFEMVDTDETVQENAEEDTGFYFFFPACRFERGLKKDIRDIAMSGQSRVLDFFRQDDTITITGYWKNDSLGEYDGRDSLDRVHEMYELCRQVECIGHFTFFGETVDVMAQELDCDQTPGEGDLFHYTFTFAIIDEYLGVTSDD